jgi:aspergillopepsin I
MTLGLLITGSISYTPVDNSEGFWSFATDSYAIRDLSYSISLNDIANTSTALLLPGEITVSNYYSQVSDAKNSSSHGS